MRHLSLQYTNGNGPRIAYDAFGTPADPAVLLVMGLGDQMITWLEEFCEMFAGKGFYIIRFDNRDVGKSEKFHHLGMPDLGKMALKKMLGGKIQAGYTLSDMARDAVSVLDALDIPKAHVVGASMGGMIAQVVGLEHPDRVQKIVSMISSAEMLPRPWMARPMARSLKSAFTGPKGERTAPSPSLPALRLLVSPAPQDREGFSDYYANIEKVLVGPGYSGDWPRTKEFAKELYDRGLNPMGAPRQLAAIMASPDRTRRLKSLQAPTLVIHGDADPLIPVWMGEKTADLIPNSEKKIYPGLGHWLPPEIWPEMIHDMAEFLRQ